MDNNNSDDAKNRDNEAADVMTDCLRNSVVLRRILEHVPSRELRQLSLVNKLWKYEAQSVMRKRGQFIAYVKSEGFDRNNPLKEVDAFISDLKLMNPVPFSGISISIDVWMTPVRNAVPMSALDVDYLQGVVLDQPTLKTASVKLRGSWMENISSPGVLLAKKVLQDCSGFLEELEVDIHEGHEYFIEKFVQDFTFPCLRILKLRGLDFWLDDAGSENYMKVILSRAPNLKVLHSGGSIDVLLSVLEGSSVVPVYDHLAAPFEWISEIFLSAIKLEEISLEYYADEEFNFEAFNRITPMLLQQCCSTTLRRMRLDAVFAIPLMTYGIRLENLKDLCMDIAYDHLENMEPRILRLVKTFDFTRIFPNLNTVKILADQSIHGLSPEYLNAMIERANAVVREPMLDRAARIKELVLYSNPSSAAAQFYSEMFPNTEKLEISKYSGDHGQVPFGSIWNWLELKELKVRGDVLPTTGNLDGLFCGIFPEEVAELRLKDDEYLKRVNIVPVRPAVTCLKNLRSLSLHHEHHRRDSFGDDATFIFSAVTVFLTFARLPALVVRLKICSEEVPPAMPHLEPYVSVTSELHDPGHW